MCSIRCASSGVCSTCALPIKLIVHSVRYANFSLKLLLSVLDIPVLCALGTTTKKKNNPRKQEAVPQNPAGFRSQQQSPWLGLVFPFGQFCQSYHGGGNGMICTNSQSFPFFSCSFYLIPILPVQRSVPSFNKSVCRSFYYISFPQIEKHKRVAGRARPGFGRVADKCVELSD